MHYGNLNIKCKLSLAKSIFLYCPIFIHILGVFDIESDFNIVHTLFSLSLRQWVLGPFILNVISPHSSPTKQSLYTVSCQTSNGIGDVMKFGHVGIKKMTETMCGCP